MKAKNVFQVHRFIFFHSLVKTEKNRSWTIGGVRYTMSPEHLVMPASKTAQKQNSKNINRSVSEEHRNQQKELAIVKGETLATTK